MGISQNIGHGNNQAVFQVKYAKSQNIGHTESIATGNSGEVIFITNFQLFDCCSM
jgi:hypothetical protein